MTQDAPDDSTLRDILTAIHVVGVVGVSPNPVRPSYFVARYLGLRGKRVIPVNPGHAGETLLGATVVAGVGDLPPEVDMLDVFRRSEHVAPIVREALDHLPGLRTVWLQIGVVSDEARAMCAERGVNFIQNRCPKIEYQRLFGELRMGGFNTGVISSRL
ncbi:MAG: CoA-binding protein [Rhodobacter sp.]|uniref:CoA-binding protein n=1 Tax=Pararhodobacter sp. TaxID=2127056 RepID=UPI001E033502|nr:CoA-binding protein [Pararhodobacter sp.]MCB1346284.1 CoA-binding protein [Paracoccaceae bacterium]MCC0073011.1 CoA-binding protein [Rhodobacter sp.]HPD94087.1 CoA-binding protein [Pararhodobacter sp.]